MTNSFVQTRGGDVDDDNDTDDDNTTIFRNDKYISTVEEGTPSYYNALMRLQILNVSCKMIVVLMMKRIWYNDNDYDDGNHRRKKRRVSPPNTKWSQMQPQSSFRHRLFGALVAPFLGEQGRSSLLLPFFKNISNLNSHIAQCKCWPWSITQ